MNCVILFLALAAPPDISFPVIIQPAPLPMPPGLVTSLPEGVFYVVTSPNSFLIASSPDGLVSVLKAQGPATLLGRFVEQPGKVQLREIKDKNFAVLTASGSGRCEILAWPVGAQTEDEIIRKLIDVNLGPRPPPVPPIPPVPEPSPAPIQADGLHVLIVYETAELSKLAKEQELILYSQTVRDYLNAKCPAVGATKEWRFWDKDVTTAAESKLWQDAMKRERKSVPWIIVSNPQKGGGFEGALPATVDETMTLLKKFGD